MKKALFICNTSYQILFTINFVSVMNEYEVGVFLTDTLPNADKLKEKLFVLGCFLEVKIVKFKCLGYQVIKKYFATICKNILISIL